MSRLIGRVTGLLDAAKGGGDPNQGGYQGQNQGQGQGGGYQPAYGQAGRRDRRRERHGRGPPQDGSYNGPGRRLVGLYNSVGNTAPSGTKGGDPYGQGQGGVQDPYGPYGQQAHDPYASQGGAPPNPYAQSNSSYGPQGGAPSPYGPQGGAPPNPYTQSNSSYGPQGGAPSPYGPQGGAASPYGPKGGSPPPGAGQYSPPAGGPSPYGPQGGSSSYGPPGGPPPNPYGPPGGAPPNPYGPPGGAPSPQQSAYAPDEPAGDLSCGDFIEGLIMDHPVMVFSTENSQEGAQVKQFFEQGYTGLHVEYFDIHPEDPMILPHLVDRSKTAQKYNGKKKIQNNVPFVFIDKVYIGGLKELKDMRKADVVGLLQGRR